MRFVINNRKKFLVALLLLLGIFWYAGVEPPKDGEWQLQLAVPSSAEFDGDRVTVRNVRNFRYYPSEADMHPGYYDKTYDLDTVSRVWYVAEPFNENKLAAHTFLSFEFENGEYLAITIEAKKQVGQTYSIWKGMLRTYPLTYIAADERDAVLLRANVRKDKVYVYPVKLSRPENGGLLLADMLRKMNKLNDDPEWYNTLWHNCTSEIAYHVNRISARRVPAFAWEFFITSSADKLALDRGLIDTELSIEEAREKYLVTEKSIAAGDTPEYSRLIREQ